MKLLFLTPQLPYPPHKGTTLRNFNIIRQLAPGHQIHLISLVGDESELEQAGPLRDLCATIDVRRAPHRTLTRRGFDSLTSRWPDMALRLWTPALRDLVRDTLARESFDVVQVEGIEMARYWLDAVGRPECRAHVRRSVFDEHNAEYVLQQRAFETDVRRPAKWLGGAYSFIQWRKLVGYERRCLGAFDAVAAVSEKDRAALLRLAPNVPIAVVPNGIDTALNTPRTAPAAGPTLVFTGTMDFRPNVDAVTWFCAQMLPLIRAQVPDVRLTIVGVNPSAAVRRLAADPAVHRTLRVTVTGWVSDPRPYIQEAAVYVVPLRMGGGTRFKVLEAMALGVPIVSTRVGCEGIDLVPDEEVLLADEPADFARAVVALLRDPARGAAMTQLARRRAEAYYDWRVIVPRLAALYE
ncbi:MAG: glycosyltransferase [Chloroflexi bacterium]|nr:glycosyltransferase [Chloroflexota bacterium]MBU1746685.1 glycosyltransferase [Chloroflexota bacterium]